jgi:hypothetical protein
MINYYAYPINCFPHYLFNLCTIESASFVDPFGATETLDGTDAKSCLARIAGLEMFTELTVSPSFILDLGTNEIFIFLKSNSCHIRLGAIDTVTRG